MKMLTRLSPLVGLIVGVVGLMTRPSPGSDGLAMGALVLVGLALVGIAAVAIDVFLPRTFPIMVKELTVYFTTPLAWVVFTAVAFVSSIFFILSVADFKQIQDVARQYGWQQLPPDWQSFRNLTDGVVVRLWSTLLVVTLFVVPLLSMRLFAEERRQKTLELLLTAPVRSIEVVLGKYLGGISIVGCTLGVTIVYPLILTAFGSSESGSALEWSTVLLGYLAMLLWGATCMAIGLFASALTDSQIVAALIAFAVLLVWMVVGPVARGLDEPWRSALQYMTFDGQLQTLLKGVLDLKPLVFFASVNIFFLLLTHRSVEAQRWT